MDKNDAEIHYIHALDDCEVEVSGTTTRGVPVENLLAVVDYVSLDGYLKVWPDDGQVDPSGCGKIWFRIEDVAHLRILHDEIVPACEACKGFGRILKASRAEVDALFEVSASVSHCFEECKQCQGNARLKTPRE